MGFSNSGWRGTDRAQELGRDEPSRGFPVKSRPWPWGVLTRQDAQLNLGKGPGSDFKGSVFFGSPNVIVKQDGWLEGEITEGLENPELKALG